MDLLTFLQGPKQFQVPIYQRRYSWEKDECEQLWDDVLHIGENENIPSHFLGSMVSMQRDDRHPRVPQWLVIDGQQRLTTISLLLSALGRAIEARKVEIGIDRRRIQNYYLFNADEDNELRYKQLLTQHDRDTLIQLLEGKDLSANFSLRLKDNYDFFETQLKGVDLKTIYEGIQKLMIVDIRLRYGHDIPQQIFDSLNSTGRDLTQSDRIRNYVLMGQEPDFQNNLYQTYWYPMEQRFGDEYTKRFDHFIRDYLTLKKRQIPNKGKVYESFKTHVADKRQPEALKKTIAEIDRYSKHYVRIALLKEEDSEIRDRLEDIHALNVEVVYPFLLEVYDDYKQERIEKAEVIEILRLTESYVFRRATCRIPTNSLNKAFATLMRNVDKSNYLESLKRAFSNRSFSERYPSNEEFQQEFLNRNIYYSHISKFSPYYLLRKLENHGGKEPVSIEDYTIEHVMPQTLSKKWEEDLGDDHEEVHQKYLHTIGNLTLTKYNPELSNRPFKEKRDHKPGGFRYSPLCLNQSLTQAEQWDEAAIVKRANELFQTALKIWIDTGVSQEIQQEDGEGWTLADHHHLTGEMKTLFEQLRERILKLDTSVTEQINKQTIAYRIDTIFVDIVPQAKRLRLSLKLSFSDTNDPRGWCKNVANVGRWGVGDVEVGISSADQLDYIMFLIGQAFEKQIEG